MRKISILCSDHCLSSSISSFVDAFAMANHLGTANGDASGKLFSWELLSPKGKPIVTSTGMMLNTNGDLSEEKADVIYIPACHTISQDELLQQLNAITGWCGEWIKKQYADGAWIAMGCCGAFVLGKVGLLKNRKVTVGWWLHSLFSKTFPDVSISLDQPIIKSEKILSAGPVNSHFNLALKIIEETAGHHLASKCAETLLVDIHKPGYIPFDTRIVMKHSNEQILKAQQWMQAHLHSPFEMNEVAKAVNMSPRTFIRQFQSATGMSPIHFLKSLRIDVARHLLETTTLNVNEVIKRIGYSDPSSFRKLFKSFTGKLPLEYRHQSLLQGTNRS